MTKRPGKVEVLSHVQAGDTQEWLRSTWGDKAADAYVSGKEKAVIARDKAIERANEAYTAAKVAIALRVAK